MFRFFGQLFGCDLSSRKYVVFAKRRRLPPDSRYMFGTFKVRAESEYAAARLFDQTYTDWSRLTVEKD